MGRVYLTMILSTSNFDGKWQNKSVSREKDTAAWANLHYWSVPKSSEQKQKKKIINKNS